MNTENFDKQLRPAAEAFVEHSVKYGVLPNPSQILATTNLDIAPIPDLTDGHYDWFLDEFEKFTKRKELERAILKCADLLEKDEYEPVEKLIKDAVQISLQKDMGMDYFLNPRERLLALKTVNNQCSTGWASLDYKLYGGFNRGELNVFLGQSGAGKSLFLQNLAVNWIKAGMNGVYVTLELAEGLCSMRIDGMMTDVNSRDIFRNLDDVELKLKMIQKNAGSFMVKYLPAQSNVNTLRAYCKELQIKTGRKIDFLCIDYLDLMTPSTVKVTASDTFIKDKYVSEELRNLATELNVLMATASQLNRTAVDEQEFSHANISGGISKIFTADNVFGIFTSRAMKERGEYQLQMMKTRNSSGVGQKIDLLFDINTLRISDPGLQNQEGYEGTIKPRKPESAVEVDVNSGVVDTGNTKKIIASPQGNKLNAMLNSLKQR